MRPPLHPSLPVAPHVAYQPFYSSHYVQAYAQSLPRPHAGPSNAPILNFNNGPSPTWCLPGQSRCSYKGCQFVGAPKTLEIHMMDRHLIYPPGWDRRPKKPEWDADSSLKGKPIPIQGTNLILDKPEDLEAWIAERKRRWPTAGRVEEKKRKMDEAIARGQLPETLHRGNKRQKTDDSGDNHSERCRGRGRARGRGNAGRGRARAVDSGWQSRSRAPTIENKDPQRPVLVPNPVTDTSDSEEDGESPEAISSKVPLVLPPEIPSKPLPDKTLERRTNNSRPSKPQPKKEPHNPFASRPTLLRNLLLPEIRVTISNLSQAIRFLVDNQFLDGVEVTPGDAESEMIQVISDKSAQNDASETVE